MKSANYVMCLGILLGSYSTIPLYAHTESNTEVSLEQVYYNEEATSGNIQQQDLENDAEKLFKDKLCTELKKGVKPRKIKSCKNETLRQVALSIYENNYDTTFRVNTFQPVYSPEALGKLLHIGNGYSTFQHVTGIVMKPGKHIIIVTGAKEGSKIGLKVAELYAPDQGDKDWSLHSEKFELKNGINIIDKQTDWTGLAYIDYYFEHPEKENEVKVHFVTGEVNGYFDASKHSNSQWDEMLSKAVYPVFDAVGSNIHLAYPVADLQKYASGKGKELIGVYEELVSKQHEIIGWKKYGLIPKNKIFARVNYGYYMFRDGEGVAFKFDTMNRVANPDHMRYKDEDACWGFSHEVGHVHQLQTYLSWGGLGETSNNICTRYCTQAFGYKNRLEKAFSSAEKNFLQDGMAGKVSKARAEGGMNDSIIVSCKENPDLGLSYLETDVFERLVPFWKLQCYFTQHGMPDFYPDLYEKMRQSEKDHPELKDLDRHKNVVPFQLNFIKGASLVAKKNLYPYFEKFGFFRLLKLTYGDYGTYTYNMTAEMRDAFKKEMEQLENDKKISPLTSEELNELIYAHE